MLFHNKHGLMGWNGSSPGTTSDRSQVKPFSVMVFDRDEGWQQIGVYDTLADAWPLAGTPAVAIGLTDQILDMAHPDNSDEDVGDFFTSGNPDWDLS